ncbi:MAG: Rieske 2Fe-2S domain-containing protein [Woeseiaceae bacterium]|nr:Rieske 2Fe-2S domain-containing protein [Woeseiaceae bacterium]
MAEFDVRPSENWYGGFFCPCHGSRFDLAGRVYKGVPAPTNLRVPPYRFILGYERHHDWRRHRSCRRMARIESEIGTPSWRPAEMDRRAVSR